MCENSQFERTIRIIGEKSVARLSGCHVAIFGIGGVGSFVCEALGRAGVGEITLVDKDTVSITNLNRQLVALHSTVGEFKTKVMAARLQDINPMVKIHTKEQFFLPEVSDKFVFTDYDYVADCVDTVTAKLELIRKCQEDDIPIISSMGTGNKLNPTSFKISMLSKTKVCPLAKVMRKECKERGYKDVKVLYSEEPPINPGTREPGSISFVPSVAGLIIAGEIIKDLIGG